MWYLYIGLDWIEIGSSLLFVTPQLASYKRWIKTNSSTFLNPTEVNFCSIFSLPSVYIVIARVTNFCYILKCFRNANISIEMTWPFSLIYDWSVAGRCLIYLSRNSFSEINYVGHLAITIGLIGIQLKLAQWYSHFANKGWILQYYYLLFDSFILVILRTILLSLIKGATIVVITDSPNWQIRKILLHKNYEKSPMNVPRY